jgi:drug/metabolite transporter (DMT)-like permease
MLLSLVAALSYALMLVALSRGPLYTNGYLVGTLINLFGALIPFSLFALTGMRMDGAHNTLGIFWGVLGGIGIALFTITMTHLFTGGGTLGFVSPLIYGAAVVIVTVVGLLAFREPIGLLHACGIALVVAGIGVIAFAQYRTLG